MAHRRYARGWTKPAATVLAALALGACGEDDPPPAKMPSLAEIERTVATELEDVINLGESAPRGRVRDVACERRPERRARCTAEVARDSDAPPTSYDIDVRIDRDTGAIDWGSDGPPLESLPDS